ncbi:Ig mu chain C region membrane-bound form [Cottoperca gobio]|uniref:Ig mu chain C region membrane-bound form n=1 Tax=Cottoperca gobio TaxID=56716 RepID=A0AC58RKY6_COTGO
MKHCDYFDYWGHGTKVTVTTNTVASPTLFPLLQCKPGSASTVTVGCLANDFYPKSLTFQWTDASGSTLTSVQYPPTEKNNKYSGVSLLQVSKSDWDSRRSFNCSVTHSGGQTSVKLEKEVLLPPKLTLLAVPGGDAQALVCTIQDFLPNQLSVKWKKNANYVNGINWAPKLIGDVYSAVSVLKVENKDWDSEAVYTCEVVHQETSYTKKASKAPITMILNQPSPKEMFNNNQAKLKCIVRGQGTVSDFHITWEIDGQIVNDNITETDQSGISTMAVSLHKWQTVNKVRCSATRDNNTSVIQDLIVQKGDGSEPKVTVHILPEEDIGKANSAEVTLVCLVSSRLLQDYYIAWLEQKGQKGSTYTDGINFPPQKTQHGYSVTSIYTTTKEKWNQYKMFSCHAWPAGNRKPMKTREVSKAKSNSTEYFTPESKVSFALNCTDDAIEEDEYSSLWSTTSSFIFLFISSLLFNMIFSLVKMKRA